MFDNLSKLIEWLKNIWVPIIGFISAITVVVQFIELWQGNQTVVAWTVTVLGIIILVSSLIWIGYGRLEKSANILYVPLNYSPKIMQFPRFYKIARLGLLILALCTIGASYFLYNKLEDSNNKVVVLISNFDGPDPQKYRVTEILWENLYPALQEQDNVNLVLLNKIIKSPLEAEAEGKKQNATIVVWGWYSVNNELARVSVHFDILKKPKEIPPEFQEQKAMRDFHVGELNNFKVQEELSEEMVFSTLTTIGLVRYSLQDWKGAVESFTEALNYAQDAELLNETQYYIDMSNAYDVMVTPSPGYTAIIATSQNIPQGEAIRGNQISFFQIPTENYISAMFTRPEDIVGKHVKFPIDQGVILTKSMTSEMSDPPSPEQLRDAILLQFLLEQYNIPILTPTASPP